MNVLYWMWKDDVISKIKYSFSEDKVEVENYSNDILKLPFGIKTDVSMNDLNEFMEERCIPRTRFNIKQILDKLNLIEYDPYRIIETTHGVMAEDFHWLRGEDEENLTFKDVFKFR